MATKPTPAEDAAIDDDLATLANPVEVEENDDLTDEDLAVLSDAEADAYRAGRDEDEDEDTDAEAEADTSDADAAAEAEVNADAERRRQTDATLATLEQQAEAARQARKDVIEKYKNGDLDDDEYEAALDRAQNSLDQINFNLGASKKPIEDAWVNACQSFLTDNEVLRSDAHFDAFNKVVGDITEDQRFMSLTNEGVLAAAKKRYALELELAGQTVPGINADAPPPPPVADLAAAKRTAKPASERPAPPPTLAMVPSETVNPNESHMAQLMARYEASSDPEVRERIIAGLPDHLVDDFMSYI